MLIAGVEAAAEQAPVETIRGVSATQLFELASSAEKVGDVKTASAIYQALTQDPNIDIRNEARFRHAQLLVRQNELANAATLFRSILDERPDAQRVRLELAAILARMGDLGGARRTLRQARAGGLPEDVARLVDQYSAALRSFKPLNASIEIALAPSNNINRATSATTLDTILAPFELSDDARAKSGMGLKIGGQASGRLPLGGNVNAMGRVAGLASFYRASQFDDWQASAELGVEVHFGKARMRPLVGRSYRWYGRHLYATTNNVSLSAERPLGARSQISGRLAAARADYRFNNLQDGEIYSGNVSYERAFSARAGGSVGLSVERQDTADAGYATTAGGMDILFWRDLGRMTLYVSGSGSRLAADERLTLFPRRRKDWQFRTGFGLTLRQLKVASFAPVIRVGYERNSSTVGLYDYRRWSAEFGITRAF